MYKMKMRIALDVIITADDSSEAFQCLERVKNDIYLTKTSNGIIRNVHTDAMLSEETFEPVVKG